MAVKVVPNPAGIKLLERSPMALAAVSRAASAGTEAAKGIAPVGPGEGGHYRDQIEAQSGVEGGRVTGRINAKKFTSGFLEKGTSDTPAFNVLARACDAIGLKLGTGE